MAASYTVTTYSLRIKPPLWLAVPQGNVDVSPDGKRLVVLSPVETGEAPQADHEVVFLQNFASELRRASASK